MKKKKKRNIKNKKKSRIRFISLEMKKKSTRSLKELCKAKRHTAVQTLSKEKKNKIKKMFLISNSGQ